MHVSQLPSSSFVIASKNEAHLASAIKEILKDHGPITHSTPIQGTERSGRILSLVSLSGFVPCTRALTSYGAARAIIDLTTEARYNPPSNPGFSKGWELRKTYFGMKPAVVIWATWV